MSAADRILLQSHRPDPPPWMRRCLDSVRAFAEAHGYAYRLLDDDALFDGIPPAYMAKCRDHGRMATAADLGRLLRARDALAEGAARAVWLDADVLVFAPGRLSADLDAAAADHSHAFGVEVWVQPGPKPGARPVARRNVHNAACLFMPATPVLDFLIHACERLVERLEPEKGFPPQLCGPRLLNALDPLVRFPLLETCGMVSPLLGADLIGAGDGRALAAFQQRSKDMRPPAALNLCSSLAEAETAGVTCDTSYYHRLITVLETGGTFP
ncbi:hypothetical protein [Caenispirillum salinarum]|uniref:hypothetical protein n=1 Tax=Caenispirillum salinarum TaxID=859058 RepID=UPI003850F9CC